MKENNCTECGIKIISPNELNVSVCSQCTENITVYSECFNCHKPIPHNNMKCNYCGFVSSHEGFLKRIIK